MNIPLLAFQTFQNTSQSTISSIYIQGADGTRYFPRFESFDSTTDQASFTMLDGLANGEYEFHLSGPNGLDDLGGNPLVGNDPGGDYVVHFSVDAPERGVGGNPLAWSDQEPNNDTQNPQDLGVLFPRELATGVTISRTCPPDPSQAPQDTADVYRFQILQDKIYTFTLWRRKPAPRRRLDARRYLGAKRCDQLARGR